MVAMAGLCFDQKISVTLQGRTYLLHRRENNTKALVFFTNGLKLDNEEDRIFNDNNIPDLIKIN
jgi:hypothetical protein